MKSEKAKEEIEHYRRYLKNCLPSYEIGEYCRLFKEIAEIAEQEVEERMREKAVEAFKSECVYRDQRCKPDCEGCGMVKQFIQKLNEE